MNTWLNSYRSLLTAVMLLIYIGTSSPKEILELAHTLSHVCKDNFSFVSTHSYFDHDDQHSHQLIAQVEDASSKGNQNTVPIQDDQGDKKHQLHTNPTLIAAQDIQGNRMAYHYLSKGNWIYLNNDTPPPIRSITTL